MAEQGGTNLPTKKAPVQTEHPTYTRMLPKWRRARDVCAGQDAVHAAGPSYLPVLKDQATEDYDAYKLRATFYGASWRTVAGLGGMLFRKPPIVEAPESVKKELLDDVTMAGVSLHVLAQTVAKECLIVGRVGVMADYPTAPAGLSEADAARLNLRATLAMYRAEAIINWRRSRIANRYVLTHVVLCEKDSTESADGFSETESERYRVLDLAPVAADDGTKSLAYRQRIFTVNDKGDQVQVGKDIFPTRAAKLLDFIPFQFIGPEDTTPDVDEPPLIDLFDMNLAHYRVTADYEHGCHFVGLPTPYVSGYSPPNGSDGTPEKLYIGSSHAWVFTDPKAKAAFLEFQGQGLQSLEKNLDRKEQQMAVLGARMLEALKKGVESAEAAGIHRVGEQSMLASVAQSISLGLTQALVWFIEWSGSDQGGKIELNRDFVPINMTPDELNALVAAWQKGAISFPTLWANLQQGEIADPDKTAEDERTAIDNAPPVLVGAPPPTPVGATGATGATGAAPPKGNANG